jgi:hypothetical protein
VSLISIIGEIRSEVRQLANLQVKSIYFIGEFPHEFRQWRKYFWREEGLATLHRLPASALFFKFSAF